MKFRRSKGKPDAEELTPAEVEAERSRLRERVHGPGHAVRSLFADDPVSLERIDRALSEGWTCDLTGVPKYRRAHHAEESLTGWETKRSGGPCAWCGCAEPRRGRAPARWSPTEPEEPRWTLHRGRAACEWCADVLRFDGDTVLRSLAFRAAAGIRSATMAERWELDRWVPFWSELEATEQAAARVGGDGPWSHVDTGKCRTLAADLVVREGTHGSGFCRTDGQADHASIPGLRASVWSAEELPDPPGVQYVGGIGRADSLHAAGMAARERLAADRERAAARAEKHAAAMRERDQKLDRMTPAERAAWEDQTARHMPGAMAREINLSRAAAEVEAMNARGESWAR